MEDSGERLDALIRSGARRLTGFRRRSFQAEVAAELCGGNARQAERRFERRQFHQLRCLIDSDAGARHEHERPQ